MEKLDECGETIHFVLMFAGDIRRHFAEALLGFSLLSFPPLSLENQGSKSQAVANGAEREREAQQSTRVEDF